MTKELSKHLLKDMQHNIDIVKDGEKTFIYVGEALRKLRDDGLYKAKYETFEELCKAEFHYSRSYSYDLINSSIIASEVSEMSAIADKTKDQQSPVIVNEGQARALAKAADDKESRVKVLKALVKDKTPITAAAIKKKADEILPPKTVKPQPVKATAKPDKPEEPKERPSQFDPSTFDPDHKAEPAKSTGDFKKRFGDRLADVTGRLGYVVDQMGPLVRALDDANTEKSLGNHKHLLDVWRRLDGELKQAKATLHALNAAFGKSK